MSTIHVAVSGTQLFNMGVKEYDFLVITLENQHQLTIKKLGFMRNISLMPLGIKDLVSPIDSFGHPFIQHYDKHKFNTPWARQICLILFDYR